MPPVAIAIGAVAVGVGVAAYGTIQSAKAQKKAARAAQDANAIQRQQAQLQGMRQRLDAIRTGRQALAQVQQTAENQGVSESSAAKGGQGSIITQMMSNVSFLDSYNNMTDLAEQSMAKAYKYQNKANMWGAIENFGFNLANAGASFIPKG
jgi:hypothetical protein